MDMILANKKKLGKGIFMDKQYSEETEQEQKRLRPVLSAARRLTEYQGKCRMEGTELIIKGKRYSWNNLQDLPKTLVPMMYRADRILWGTQSLSNFHPAPFILDGISYSCSEQYIQARKASFCDDQVKLSEILETPTALACKNLGKEIQNCDIESWNKDAVEECYPGILAKFQQNPGLVAFLKNTGTKTILECCYEESWGNGIPLSNPQCIDPKLYKDQGILGKWLSMCVMS